MKERTAQENKLCYIENLVTLYCHDLPCSDNKINVRHDLWLNSIIYNLLVQKLEYIILSTKNSFRKKKNNVIVLVVFNYKHNNT